MTPGPTAWVSMVGTADTTVPNDSSYLEGAENISVDGIENTGSNGLDEVPQVFDEGLRVGTSGTRPPGTPLESMKKQTRVVSSLGSNFL